jgi:hypothetical protein
MIGDILEVSIRSFGKICPELERIVLLGPRRRDDTVFTFDGIEESRHLETGNTGFFFDNGDLYSDFLEGLGKCFIIGKKCCR